VPTFKEAGYPDLEVMEWYGVFLPAKTPATVVDGLNTSIQAALKTPELKEALTKLSFEVGGHRQADFARLVKSDTERWGPVVVASGFTPEN
jgi:tripartite-type tricarboxylate transporter receptor subunit TctC